MINIVKIAYLCSDVGVPVLGFKGCSVHVREMASALAGLGADVSVYALLKGQGNQYPNVIKEVSPFKKKWMGRDLCLIVSNMNLYLTCKKQFRVRKPNFIYERYGLYGWAGVKLAREFSIPIIVEINSFLAEKEKDRLHFPRLAKRLETLVLKRAETVCCLSEISKSLLLKGGVAGEKILVTPDGVNLDKFSKNRDGREIRKRFGMEGKIVVGYIGVLRRFWGIYTILESAREILSQRNDFHFIVIGEGKEYLDMKKFLEKNNLTDNFTMTGTIPHDDIPEYIAAIDIGLAPYGYEEPFYASPMKIFEYMAMGKPIIATAQGQIKDIIRHGENGLLMEPDDSSGLAKAIRELGSNKDMMKNMGLKARATVESYTWEANARKVLDTYRALVNGETAPSYEN
ncbi:MAG: hypothetical protein B1H12_05930 [Desulfobacteraceae bacterium 4484_190.2]|nr:MAG: hypothetical protein B1H12_05930 [Desulfobacteraceae bacterium 4484_190.2]